jgi:tRNA pseudouridine65 synthase
MRVFMVLRGYQARMPRSELRVLQAGDDWVVIAKPPRLLVHRTAQAPTADAVVQTLRDQLGRHVYPVHRLDRGASGCLLVATSREAAGLLNAALAEAAKVYVAFVRGAFREEDAVVETPMKDDNGILKDARSLVHRLGASEVPRCSLLEVRPETGRYHQVRRHVRDLGHPVIGDREHGDSRVNGEWRARDRDLRLGLHAISLAFSIRTDRVEVTCPLFRDHHALWSTLPWWSEAVARCPALALEPLEG